LSLERVECIVPIRHKISAHMTAQTQQVAESDDILCYEPTYVTLVKQIMLMPDNDFRHSKPTYLPLVRHDSSLDAELYIQSFRFLKVRAYFCAEYCLPKLSACGTITPHIDRVPFFVELHRVHLPITKSHKVLV